MSIRGRLKDKSFIIVSLILVGCFVNELTAQSYKKLHSKAIVVDTHNDILTQVMEKGVVFDTDLRGKTHSDFNRWKQGGLDVQFFSVWSDGEQKAPFAFANRQLDTLDVVIRRNRHRVEFVYTTKQLRKVVKQHKMAALVGLEGGHQIEDDLGKLDSLYKRGVRYMTLTWNNSTSWASSAFDETSSKELSHKGLNDFGRQVLTRMNALGMMVDISHVGEATFWDVMKTTTKPVIASHSSVYTICPHPRNLKDDQIKAIAQNGGVIQVNFYSAFIDSTYTPKKNNFLRKHQAEIDSMSKLAMAEYLIGDHLFKKYPAEVQSMRPPFSLLMDHIDYLIKLAGVDHVGLGSDFDGIESAPIDLDDVTTYPLITKALVEKGYRKKDINKILGGNLLRVLEANEEKK